MRCDDIHNELQADDGDLKAIARHLKACPVCAAKYGEQLDWEMSLRGLANDIAPVDISGELSRHVNLTNKRIRYIWLLRHWVWGLAGALAIAIIAFGLPTFVEWLQTATSWMAANLPGMEAKSIVDLNKWNNELKSSEYFYYIMIGAAAIIAAVLSYLWRELKEIA